MSIEHRNPAIFLFCCVRAHRENIGQPVITTAGCLRASQVNESEEQE